MQVPKLQTQFYLNVQTWMHKNQYMNNTNTSAEQETQFPATLHHLLLIFDSSYKVL